MKKKAFFYLRRRRDLGGKKPIYAGLSLDGFPGDTAVKNLPANAGDIGSILGSRKVPWRRACQPTPVFLPGKSHGQKSLVGLQSIGSQRVRDD